MGGGMGAQEGEDQSVQWLIPSFVSYSLPSCGLQHTRFPCPSATPRAPSNSCPSSLESVMPPNHLLDVYYYI